MYDSRSVQTKDCSKLSLPKTPSKGWLRTLTAEDYDEALAPKEANNNDGDTADTASGGSNERDESAERPCPAGHPQSSFQAPTLRLTLPKNILKDQGSMFHLLHKEIPAH
jgi:hypothetical protein